MSSSSTSPSSPSAQAVHLAIYDLSQGMARTLSSQFLGAQHAVDIIPHTAILAFGKEYYFGMGIQACRPHEFRMSRGIHPIEIQLLGYTTQTREEFEIWCQEQTISGNFDAAAYDFFHKNCNNFSEEAAKSGLGLSAGVPSHILELPAKFLSSPMGMMIRPWLEQMQIMNNNTGTVAFGSTTESSKQEVATPTNPWANIPANNPPAPSTGTTSNVGMHVETGTCTKVATPILDKQTALLAADAGIVDICVHRLKTTHHEEENEDICQLLLKLSDDAATWTNEEIRLVHSFLCNIIQNESSKCRSYALMLMRLVMLKHDHDDNTTPIAGILAQTMQLMMKLVHDEEDTSDKSEANRSMAWCVLSNAIGATNGATFALGCENEESSDGLRNDQSTGGYSFNQIVDRALKDCDSSKEKPWNAYLRQSAVAFLYNSARYLTFNDDAGTDKLSEGDDEHAFELSECIVSVLLGCIEHMQSENDATTMQRLYMTVGQILVSRAYGRAATTLVNDLGLMDEEVMRSAKLRGGNEVEGLASEVAALLRG
ncbi:hypothetical protein ACHAWU_002640 [Discostella pseudostelligera]|uniref:PPPDE domain-containing protein n=1 Tax=Discostella pseudostelligera TaxID=259834 RepID=A0ABD3LWG6_9STRA